MTISKFGALNCALLGLFRKMLSLVLSFVLYGHTINAFQTVGLGLALVSMIANFYEKVFVCVFVFVRVRVCVCTCVNEGYLFFKSVLCMYIYGELVNNMCTLFMHHTSTISTL